MHEAAMVRQMAGRAPEADRRNPEEVLGRGEEGDSVTVSNAPVGTSSAPANARMCFRLRGTHQIRASTLE